MKIKPLYFVSTVAVLSTPNYYQVKVVYEHAPLGNGHEFQQGYEASKWVAKNLVMTAHPKGLPVYIYRHRFISGDSQTGIGNTADLICRMLKGCIQMGKTPDLQILLDMTAVDYVSQAIVYLPKQKN